MKLSFASSCPAKLMSLALSVSMIAGCATRGYPPYSPSAQPSLSARTVERDGLAITVDPFFDSGRSECHFGVDAWKAGFLVVYFQVENHTDQTFLIQRKNIKVLLGDATGRQTDDSQGPKGTSVTGQVLGYPAVFTAALAMVAPAALLVSLPLMIVGGSSTTHAKTVRQNFVNNEFRDGTVSPGEKIQGFFYFRFDQKRPFPGATMIITCPTTITHLETRIEISITQ